MNTITYSQRYFPHELNTKFYAVKLYRTGVGVSFVCRRYHISKSSLMRWNKKFDGTKESLIDKSHRPLSKHPNAHTDEELKWIQDYHRRNPKISVCELMVSSVLIKGIPDIQAHCTAFIVVLVILVLHLLLRTSANLSLMTLHLRLESSGKWM